MATSIKHVFVLMLENRSFDHIFGFSHISGADSRDGTPRVARAINEEGLLANPDTRPGGGQPIAATAVNTPFQLTDQNKDPPHEFESVVTCLCGGGAWAGANTNGRLNGNVYPGTPGQTPNNGFVSNLVEAQSNLPELSMHCFAPEQLPVLNALAREFVLCDNWFSSLPGPTWPNRYFVHAASSAGLDNSPDLLASAVDVVKGFRLSKGTVFQRLEDHGKNWLVIEGDNTPHSITLRGMPGKALEGRFRDMDDFAEIIGADDFDASYVFIEPSYDLRHNFDGGNSMHPLGDVRKGEALVKQVYETLRASPVWTSSMLLVLFDEHGGFYDHVPPPAAVPPGDTQPGSENNAHNFAFDRLGVRVPCIICSPWVGKNLVDNTLYDHSSIPQTVLNWFAPDTPLTQRAASASTFDFLVQPTARTDTLKTLPDPFPTTTDEVATRSLASTGAPSPAMAAAFAQIGLIRQHSITPPQHQQALLAKFDAAQGKAGDKAQFARDADDAIQDWKDCGRPAPVPSMPPQTRG